MMKEPKLKSPGRPKHVAEYATGNESQNNFMQAMKAVLTPKKLAKKKAA